MRTHHYILLLFALLLSTVSSCSDEEPVVPDTTVHYAISLSDSWTDGLSRTRATETRALTRPDAPQINSDAYPAKVFVVATNSEGEKKKFTLIPATGEDAAPDTDGYSQYHQVTPDPEDDELISLSNAKDYTFTAYSQLPKDPEPTVAWTVIPAIGTIDYLKAEGSPSDEATAAVYHQGNHIFFHLRHQTALIRFVLGVDAAYLNIRDFKLTSLELSADLAETPATPVSPSSTRSSAEDPVDPTPDPFSLKTSTDYTLRLTSTGSIILQFYVEPTQYEKLFDKTLTLTATYNVYDKSGKDGALGQLTREDCKASNKLTLTNFFKNADGSPVTLTAGNYYDILVTLAPDFLYVLSDNDNKSDLELK